MMKFIYVLGLILLSFNLISQRGKDGPITIASSTIVNVYTTLTSNVTTTSTTLPVGNSGAFAVGDLILIIQMQGTSVNSYHGGTTGPWFDTNSALPTDTTFGKIINYYNTGKNEFAQISSIPNATSIVVDCTLKNNYDVINNINTPTGNINLLGHVQVIKVPRYSSLTVNTGGSITCPQWDGNTGGIAVVEVQNNTQLNAAGSFNVSGKGFRAGAVFNYTPTTIVSSDKYGSNLSQEGGGKGESIAGDSGFYRNYASVFARGNIANGGGGGNSHNAGGGGGANGHNGVNFNSRGNPVSGYTTIWNLETPNFALNTSSGGGRGGYSFSNSNQNVSTVPPGTYSTSSNPWGGDKRRAVGGFGGRPLNYINGVLFLGGGGGGGQGNDNKAGAGGNGGGMVFLVCYGNLSGTGTIIADGANGFSSTLACASNDGAGGGGGGGTIILGVNGTTNLTAATPLSANGGNGGNVAFNCAIPNSTAYGPGAGGGGGYIASSGSLPINTIIGGNNGIVSGNNNNIGTNFPPNGATKGGSGGTGSITVYTLTTSSNPTLCANQAFTVTASSTEPGTSINWFNTNTGGTAITTGTAYAAPGYTAAGTYTLFAGSCPGTYRQPIIITVNAGLTISVNSPTICPNQTVTLTASGAATYTWMPGSITGSTLSVSPSSTTIYTVNGASSLCSGTKTTNVTVSSAPTISVPNATICSGTSTVLAASGTSTSFTWMPGNVTTSTISANSNATYTITGSNGTCTNSTTASVSVAPTPTLSASSKTICAGQVATFTVIGATNYTWNPGAVVGNTFTISPASSTTVSVIGANGSCTAQITPSVTVSPNPTITVSSQTICPSQTVTLTAGGATTYTWSTGQNTNTISVSPATNTIYTVTGTTNLCTNSATVSVTVSSQPTISVANATLCSGNSTTLTASGASSYTWMPGTQTTASISVNPSSTSNYTVIGSNGTCTNSSVASVSVTNTPTLIANSATICPGQTATLTVSGATSYTWNPGNTSGTNYTISPASNSTVTVAGANGNCSSSTTVSVTIGTGISITVNSPTICARQTASLTASGATSYTWDTGANTNTLNVSPASTQVYTISGTSGSCSGVNTATVTVVNQPTLSVANASICSGNTTTLTASGATNYTWSPGGQFTSTVSVSPANTATYTIVGSNGTCTNSTSAIVNVTPTPSLVANSVTICPSQTATLTVSGAGSYIWNPGGVTGNTYTINPSGNSVVTIDGANGTCTSQATASVTIGTGISITVNSPTICAGQTASLTANGAASYTWNTGANTNTLNVSPASTQIYTISGTSGSCSGINTATVTVVNQPTLSVANASICSGNTTTLTASGATNYTWTPGGQTTVSISVIPSSTTIYTITGDDGTCLATTTATVDVTPTPTVTANSVTVCAGQSATLTASGAATYTWNTLETTATINPLPVNTSTYSVIGSNGACSSSFTTTITVSQSPTLTVNALNTSGCAPLCVNFSDITSASCSTIQYNYGDGSTGNTNNPTYCYTTSGNFSVTATCTNTLGCSSTYTLPSVIQVDLTPVADFTIQEGNLVVVGTTVHYNNTSTNATLYNWSLCDGSTSSSQNINMTYQDTGNCCVTLLASNSTCTNSATKCINFVREATISIPNVFTPNGDASNELFKITSTGIKSLNCIIYDRWGLKMHEWNGLKGYWDGNAKSGGAPSGTYFYIINYTDQLDKSTTEKGFLNLFRD